jgi:hypothetical protein
MRRIGGCGSSRRTAVWSRPTASPSRSSRVFDEPKCVSQAVSNPVGCG